MSESGSCVLTALPLRQWAEITTLIAPPGAQGGVDQRLKELGFLPGARVRVVGVGLFGRDPLAVQINGTKFALRRAEASRIEVRLLQGASP